MDDDTEPDQVLAPPAFRELLERSIELGRIQEVNPNLVERLQELIDDLVLRLLYVEGPPPEPLSESTDIRQAFVRTPSGRPRAVAQTWVTGPWRCLLIELPSTPMGRPIFIPRQQDEAKERYTLADFNVILPSRTQTAIRRIKAACEALAITQPIGEGAVHAIFGAHRTFVAWRKREENESFCRDLAGDVDNYAKTILDALQTSGVVYNDRGVVRLTAAKELPASWETPPPSLEDALRREIVLRKAQGVSLEAARVELRLSKAHMARLFPEEYTATSQKMDPDQAKGRALQALELIKTGTPYLEARRSSGAPADELKGLVMEYLRPRVLKRHTSLQDLAHELKVDLRTATRLFGGDDTALKALRRASKHQLRSQAAEQLQKAVQDVAAGIPISQAAHAHRVSEASLRSKLARAKRKS